MTILLLSILLFLFLGVPIAYSLGLSALCYFVVHEPGLMVVMPQRLMAGMDSFALIALTLFIFMEIYFRKSLLMMTLHTVLYDDRNFKCI